MTATGTVAFIYGGLWPFEEVEKAKIRGVQRDQTQVTERQTDTHLLMNICYELR